MINSNSKGEDMIIEDKVLEMIHEKKIKPEPRWKFKVSNTVTWMIFLMFVAGISLTLGVVLFAVSDFDQKFHNTGFTETYDMTAYIIFHSIWVVLTIIIIIFAFGITSRGRNAYKHTRLIAYLTSFGCVLLACIFFLTNVTEYAENTALRNLPYFSKFIKDNDRDNFPEQIILFGTVINSSSSLVVKDATGNVWYVVFSSSTKLCDSCTKAGKNVRVFGIAKSQNIFVADLVSLIKK
ncbi:MAG: hypothetical protein WCP15_01450 [bacterium]